MDIDITFINDSFFKNSKYIAEERKILREAILEVIKSQNDCELTKERYQQIVSGLGEYGLSTQTVNDEQKVLKKLKQDFTNNTNQEALHSALFFSNKSLLTELRELCCRNKEAIQTILKIDVTGIIEKEILLFQDITSFDDRSIQKLLRELDEETVEKALIGECYSVKEKILRNMSDKMKTIIKTNMGKLVSETSETETFENQAIIMKEVYKLVNSDVIISQSKFSASDRLCY